MYFGYRMDRTIVIHRIDPYGAKRGRELSVHGDIDIRALGDSGCTASGVRGCS